MLELKIGLFLVFSLLVVSRAGAAKSDDAPEQIHIAYGDDPTTSMYVVWNTVAKTATSLVKYYADGHHHDGYTVAEGVSRKFKDGGSEHRVQYIHRVKVTGLTPGQKYHYKCGTNHSFSDKFSFTAMKSGSDWSPSLAVYGDLGKTNAQSLPRLLKDKNQDMYDAVLHIGDFAYDMDDDNARVGDDFMRKIEPLAAYMTCPGNHENYYNFSNYRYRFVMPGDELGDRMYFSFNMGPAHIISLNTEYYFYLQYGHHLANVQYEWLEQDLQEAAKPENRAKRPWIITMGHRPMYCSNNDGDDCTEKEGDVRTGISSRNIPGLEDLFYKYGVDLQLWAHEHSYERLWPLYNRTVYNGSVSEPYTNPGAPVHIITGSAGCSERHDHFIHHKPSWSAYRSDDYGYTRMTIHNATHLYMEQVSDDKDGDIIDRMWLKIDRHGPFPPRE